MAIVDDRWVPSWRGCDALERGLVDAGFRCVERDRWLKATERSPELRTDPPRFHYRRGDSDFRVLTPSCERPWWTIQRWRGSNCHWFVDIPLDVPVSNVLGFLGV